METYLKSFDGRIVGILETDSQGNQTLRDFDTRQILGYYRAEYDDTTDFYGRVIARGNTVTTLLRTFPN